MCGVFGLCRDGPPSTERPPMWGLFRAGEKGVGSAVDDSHGHVIQNQRRSPLGGDEDRHHTPSGIGRCGRRPRQRPIAAGRRGHVTQRVGAERVLVGVERGGSVVVGGATQPERLFDRATGGDHITAGVEIHTETASDQLVDVQVHPRVGERVGPPADGATHMVGDDGFGGCAHGNDRGRQERPPQ